MNKEQTALDVSRDIEVANVMPQQAAQEPVGHFQRRSEFGPWVEVSPGDDTTPLYGAPVQSQPVAHVVDYDRDQGESIIDCSLPIGTALYAAPKVDAAVPADLGAREQTDFVSLAGFLATAVLEYPDFDCDNEAEPRPLCSLARQVLAAASQGAPKEAEPVGQFLKVSTPCGEQWIQSREGDEEYERAIDLYAAPAVALQEAAQPVAKQFPVLTAQEYYDRHCIADDNDREAFDDALDADAMLELRDRTLEEAAKVIESMHERISDPSLIGADRADAGHNTLTNCAKAIRALKNDPAQQDSKDARIAELETQLKQCLAASDAWARTAGSNSMDADRYRWLKVRPRVQEVIDLETGCDTETLDEQDAAIDAAIAKDAQ